MSRISQNKHQITGKTITCAVLGCGTIGGAVASSLANETQLLSEKTGLTITLRYIVDLNFDHAKTLGLSESYFTNSLEDVLQDDEVEIVIELMGGTTVARDFTKRALEAKKNVVTANKALIAKYGVELLGIARENGVVLLFEASCGGGIPIIRALYDGVITNRINALYGIVNGTCNYILTEMIQKGQSYAQALSQAQDSGLAEADPTLDVSGVDSAHKIAILAAIAFGVQIDYESVPVQGIDTLELIDVKFGQELGYIVKLLAIAVRKKEGISLRVRPAFIHTDHPLAWVSGPFNAVSVYGHTLGHTMYYGRGAGATPTASAVLADVTSIGLGTAQPLFNTLPIWQDVTEPANQLPLEKNVSRFYLRLMVQDVPGVFSKFSKILGDHNISISAVLQKDPHEENGSKRIVPVVITTHAASEGDIRKALIEIDALEESRNKCVCINILDEHVEFSAD